jgi:hypothetical protein
MAVTQERGSEVTTLFIQLQTGVVSFNGNNTHCFDYLSFLASTQHTPLLPLKNCFLLRTGNYWLDF